MDNWELFFKSHILERGYNYFKSGAIVDISVTDSGYAAIVEGMSEAETKTFLLDLVSKDSTIGNLVISAFSKSIGQGEIGRLKREIDNIVNRYTGRTDFIDYYHANDFIDEIEAF